MTKFHGDRPAGGGGQGSFTLGPETNTFTAATRAAAITARDAYATANAAWLAEYDARPSFFVHLRWPATPTNSEFFRRDGSAWVSVAGILPFKGDKGDAGSNSAIEVRYRATATSTPPNVPNNLSGWSVGASASTTDRYLWQVVRTGTVGSLPAWNTITPQLIGYYPQDGTDDQTGPEIVALLEALTGTSRLSAVDALRLLADAIDAELGQVVWRTGGVGGGTTILRGNGTPANTLGDDTNWYLNLDDGAWFVKTSGAWGTAVYTDMVGLPGTTDGVINSLALHLTNGQLGASAGRTIGNAVQASAITLPFLLLAGGALTGALTGTSATFSAALAAGATTLTGLLTGTGGEFSAHVSAAAAPTLDAHLANKAYVDAVAMGVTPPPPADHNRYLALGADAVFTETDYTSGTIFTVDTFTFPTFTTAMFPGVVVPSTNPITTFTQLGAFNQDITHLFTKIADIDIGGTTHEQWVGIQAFPTNFSGIQVRTS